MILRFFAMHFGVTTSNFVHKVSTESLHVFAEKKIHRDFCRLKCMFTKKNMQSIMQHYINIQVDENFHTKTLESKKCTKPSKKNAKPDKSHQNRVVRRAISILSSAPQTGEAIL